MRKGNYVVFNGSGKPLEIREDNVTPLKDGEILVKNLYTTLCGSDIHTYSGQRQEACPSVLGHEIVGEIVEIDEGHSGLDNNGEKLVPGNIITWSIFSSDPDSIFSKEGIPQKGAHLFKYGHAKITKDNIFHGGLAEYCILHKNTGVLKIPSTIPLSIAATLNCAISTVAAAVRLAESIQDKNVLVFGAGMLGITCISMCKEAGAKWVGTADISDKRLRKAGYFGADEQFNTKEDLQKTTQLLKEKFEKGGVDVVFDFSGVPAAMEQGMEVLAIGGYAVWIGAVFKNRKIQIDAEQVIRKIHTIRGIHNYNFDDFKAALNFLKNNYDKYPFDTMVEKEFSLQDIEAAFKYAIEHKPLRVGIKI